MGWARLGMLALALAAAGCEPRLVLGSDCRSASECDVGLVCRLGRCRTECAIDRDCPLGARCLLSGTSGACALPSEASCTAGACPMGTVCLVDGCATECATDGDCPGGPCVAVFVAGVEVRGCGDAHAEPDAGARDAGGPGDVGASLSCPDLTGYYLVSGSCVPDLPISVAGPVCVRQTRCELSQVTESVSIPGVSSSAGAAWWHYGPAYDIACSGGVSAPAGLAWTCEVTRPLTATCMLTYDLVALPGASRPCGCDVRGADCPGGRCGIVESSDGTLVPACVAALGTARAGMPCTRDAQGIDDCTAGHGCLVTATGVPPVCRAICASGNECAVGEACASFTATSTEGVCVPRCVPFDGSCPSGSGCRIVVTRGTAGPPTGATACVPGASGVDGDPCRGYLRCAADYVCLTQLGSQACQSLCDATHPCTGGRTCRTPIDNSVPLSPGIQACEL